MIYKLKKDIIYKALKDETFKKNLLKDPRKTIEENYDVKISETIDIIVLQDEENKMHLVIPAHLEMLSDEEMESLAAGGGRPTTVTPWDKQINRAIQNAIGAVSDWFQK